MDIEHIAFQVSDPVAAAEWYVRTFGMRIVRSTDAPAHARYLADRSGHVMIEIYNNPEIPVPDYRAMDPRAMHLAFEAADVEGMRRRALGAGASPEGEITYAPNGDVIAMLRDPWGLPIQLARRSQPMI